MTDLAVPPCDADVVALPEKGTRVQRTDPPRRGRLGTVHDTDPVGSRLLVLVDGAMFSDWYLAADWEAVEPDPDEDDGFGEHDRDDTLYDERREEALS